MYRTAYHFVARLDVRQYGGHFQSGGARVGQQCLAAAGALLQPTLALLGEATVSSHLTLTVRLGDVPKLFAAEIGLIEGYSHKMVVH